MKLLRRHRSPASSRPPRARSHRAGPPLNIKTASIDSLKHDPRNARKHPEKNIQVIEKALRNVGAARSIVIDEDNVVLAGNGVLEAAKNAGLHKVVVVDVDGSSLVAVRRTGLTDEQKTHLAIADNRAAELSVWDDQVLNSLLARLDPDDVRGMELEIPKMPTEQSRLVPLEVQKPPDLGWVLIGVPLEKFGQIQGMLDELPPECIVNTRASNERTRQD